jgi:hypothetical protein
MAQSQSWGKRLALVAILPILLSSCTASAGSSSSLSSVVSVSSVSSASFFSAEKWAAKLLEVRKSAYLAQLAPASFSGYDASVPLTLTPYQTGDKVTARGDYSPSSAPTTYPTMDAIFPYEEGYALYEAGTFDAPIFGAIEEKKFTFGRLTSGYYSNDPLPLYCRGDVIVKGGAFAYALQIFDQGHFPAAFSNGGPYSLLSACYFYAMSNLSSFPFDVYYTDLSKGAFLYFLPTGEAFDNACRSRLLQDGSVHLFDFDAVRRAEQTE